MREAIGSSLLLNVVIVVIGVISAFMIGSIAYSKAYKVKNRIISVIERYDGKCFDSTDDTDECYKEIEAELQDIGYSSNIHQECDKITIDNNDSGILSAELVYPHNTNYNRGHRFCVYKYVMCDTESSMNGNICDEQSNQLSFYKVVAFMHFDIPLIGKFLEFGVSGESKTYYNTFVTIKTK